jgi:hypothetical protein
MNDKLSALTARPALLGLLVAAATLTAGLVPPTGQAAPPFDEVNDIQWCVDQTSSLVQGAVDGYAGFVSDTYDANYRSVKCKLHQRPPITIDATFTPALGQAVGITRGTGTASDPYVIENWEIAGSDKATVYPASGSPVTTPSADEWRLTHKYGIRIANTAAHFLISKVYVHGFNQCPTAMACSPVHNQAAIQVVKAPNVRIEGSVLTDNTVGVYFERDWTQPMGAWAVRNSIVRSNAIGLYATGENSLAATGNEIRVSGTQATDRPTMGIYATAWCSCGQSITVQNNGIFGPGGGTGIYAPWPMPVYGGNVVSGWAVKYDPVPDQHCDFVGDYGSCTFFCQSGQTLAASSSSGVSGDWPRTRVVCGGVDNHCQNHMGCHARMGTTSVDGYGTCVSQTVRNWGSCSGLTNSCSFVGDSGRCSFECAAGQSIHVGAYSRTNGDFPRTHAKCGTIDNYCQGSLMCFVNLGQTWSSGLGLCYTETVRNEGYCTAA